MWDSYGRLLFQSSPLDYAVTSVAWCPSGEMFAAGSFDSLQLCDRMGWAYCKVGYGDEGRSECGSEGGSEWFKERMGDGGRGGLRTGMT